MKKNLFFVVMSFVALAFVSCNREEPTPDNPSNSGEFDTYAEIEKYCIDNGWSECNLQYIYGNHSFSDYDNAFHLSMDDKGTLSSPYWDNGTEYKLCSSFSSLLSIDTPPDEGYVKNFTCEKEKFGVCKCYRYNSYDSQYAFMGYSKFYIKRMDSEKIKIYYKKCDW